METLALSDAMLKEFQEGCLAPLRETVGADDTLTMRFLGRQVEIDYRGQVIIKVWQIGDKYSVYTMPFFNRYLNPAEGDNMDKILNLIPHFKHVTDDLLWEDPDTLRERRQRMERINNRATATSKQTDYYLVASDYRRAGTRSTKAVPIDIVALKGFVGEDETDQIPKLRLALIQMCPENVETPIAEQAYWENDLNVAMDGYLSLTRVLDKAAAALALANDEAWTAELKDSIRLMFQQKCDMGLIDRYLAPGTEIEIDEAPPEVDLVALDMNPKRIGIGSQFYRLSVDDGPDRFFIFEGSPMGMALFEDCLLPLQQFLDERPVPKSRMRMPLALDSEDVARLQAACWLLELVKKNIEDGSSIDWHKLGQCLSRMEAFVVQLQKRERGILEALKEPNEHLDQAVKELTEIEDALGTFQQLDSVEEDAGELSQEMRGAALELLQSVSEGMKKVLDEYGLPVSPPTEEEEEA